MLLGHTVGAVVLADMLQKTVPILKSQEFRQDFKRAVAGGVGTVDVAPKTFQRGGADVFVGAFPDGTAEEGEVGGSLHLAAEAFLDLLLQF